MADSRALASRMSDSHRVRRNAWLRLRIPFPSNVHDNLDDVSIKQVNAAIWKLRSAAWLAVAIFFLLCREGASCRSRARHSITLTGRERGYGSTTRRAPFERVSPLSGRRWGLIATNELD